MRCSLLLVLVACGHHPSALGDASGDDAAAGRDASPDAPRVGDARLDDAGTRDATPRDAAPGDAATADGGQTACPDPTVCATLATGTDGAALAVAVDASRNVYVAGLVSSDLVLGGHTLYAIGNRDAFVASFAPDGSYRWGKRLGGANAYGGAYGVAVDDAANVYIVGGGTGPIDLGGGVLGGGGMFVASYTQAGAFRWARNDGGGSGAFGVATAGTHVYVLARFLNQITFDALPPLTAAGAEDVVVAAFDRATGAALWARQIGTPATDEEGGITARGDAVTISVSTALVGSGERLVSWTAAGAPRFDVALPAALDQRGLASDAAGNLYLTGRHQGSDTIAGAPSNSGWNPFVHAYTDLAATRWSWTLTEAPAQQLDAIPLTVPALDPAGNLVVAGTYRGTLYAGGTPLPNEVEQIFLAHFAASGTPLGARRIDDGAQTAYEWVHGLAIDSANVTYIAGQYFGIANFGDGPLPFAPEGGVMLLRLAP